MANLQNQRQDVWSPERRQRRSLSHLFGMIGAALIFMGIPKTDAFRWIFIGLGTASIAATRALLVNNSSQ
ncbi:MAG: hypothetical protein KME43_13410 [Myxacorys chilensis ATA2-1-KO14]|jgi:hypothetical protein|nr:hypothetical protein [Myxacorys chilensis ATA2-1-KO14]